MSVAKKLSYDSNASEGVINGNLKVRLLPDHHGGPNTTNFAHCTGQTPSCQIVNSSFHPPRLSSLTKLRCAIFHGTYYR